MDLKPVEIGRIEPELRRLWREQAGERAQNEQALLCVRTLNLVIYSPDSTRDEIATLLDPLVAEHPARVIAIHATPGKHAQAWISAAHIRPLQAGRSIGRELISIECGPEAHRELRSVVLPLLVHDLPVFLWWRGQPQMETDLFRDFLRLADRIIVDSDELDEPARGLANLLRSLRGIEGAVSDLAWARLTPWRQLTAQFFSAPPANGCLEHLTNVAIEYGGELPSRAVLLAAWLASRLGWSPGKLQQAPFAVEFRRGNTPINVEFRRVSGRPRGITAFTLATEDARFTVSRVADTGCFVTTSEIGSNVLRRRVPRQNQSETQLISRELDLPGRDILYEQALDVLPAILEQ